MGCCHQLRLPGAGAGVEGVAAATVYEAARALANFTACEDDTDEGVKDTVKQCLRMLRARRDEVTEDEIAARAAGRFGGRVAADAEEAARMAEAEAAARAAEEGSGSGAALYGVGDATAAAVEVMRTVEMLLLAEPFCRYDGLARHD